MGVRRRLRRQCELAQGEPYLNGNNASDGVGPTVRPELRHDPFERRSEGFGGKETDYEDS